MATLIQPQQQPKQPPQLAGSVPLPNSQDQIRVGKSAFPSQSEEGPGLLRMLNAFFASSPPVSDVVVRQTAKKTIPADPNLGLNKKETAIFSDSIRRGGK